MSQDICDSEHLLGRRIVNYLRNEATVGRINTQKLKVVRFLVLYFCQKNLRGKLLHYIQYGVNNQKQKDYKKVYFIIKKTIVTLKFFKLQPRDKTLENFTKYYHDFLLCLNLKIASVQPEEGISFLQKLD